MNETVYLTDRTSIETDWECGMRYWWFKKEGGTGIEPKVKPPYFVEGAEIHRDLVEVAQDTPLATILENIPAFQAKNPTQIELEVASRRAGWVAAFALFQEPFIRSLGEPISVEKEFILDRNPLYVAYTPDRILKRDNKLRYIEYKSAGRLTGNWAVHWPYAIQLHIGLAGIEEEFRLSSSCGNVLGFYKGEQRDGRLTHPYVWAYRRGAEWSSGYKSGFEHAPVWEYPEGMIGWVTRLGQEGAGKVMSWSEPVYLDRRYLESIIQRRISREAEIVQWASQASISREVREQVFEQRTIHCRPVIGPACPYLAACFDAAVNLNPTGTGLYVKRSPHHEAEELWNTDA